MLATFLKAATSLPAFDYITVGAYGSASTTTVTLSGLSFGDPDGNRRVIAAFSWTDSSTGTISSVTIGGVSATRVVRQDPGAVFRNDEIWIASVPTGATGDIVIVRDLSSVGTNVRCAVFRAVGPNIALHDTESTYNNATGVNSSRSVNLTVPAYGFSVATYGCGAAATGTTTSWTNMTERTDILVSNVIFSSAGMRETSATTKTVTAVTTDSSVNRPGLVAASWSF
jgi:hypothetical protein